MEYEYEWAQEAGLYIFPFLRTYDTVDVPPLPMDPRMDQFRLVEGLTGILPRVFLSYSRKDLEYIRGLQQRLREQDLHAWRDEVSIPGGAEWARVHVCPLKRLPVCCED